MKGFCQKLSISSLQTMENQNGKNPDFNFEFASLFCVNVGF